MYIKLNNKDITKILLYNETYLSQALNKLESCINQTLDKALM
jgi:hypothetical protein